MEELGGPKMAGIGFGMGITFDGPDYEDDEDY